MQKAVKVQKEKRMRIAAMEMAKRKKDSDDSGHISPANNYKNSKPHLPATATRIWLPVKKYRLGLIWLKLEFG